MATTTRDRNWIEDGGWIWLIVLAAWTLLVTAFLTGQTRLVNHDAILGDQRIPGASTLLLFLVAWQVMTAGMMLPSSLPMMRLFARASRGQARPRLALGFFLAGYFIVWTGFAFSALVFDDGVHTLVDNWSWLSQREFLISVAVLAVAGAFQFTPLKERCLRECSTPLGFLWRHYDRGLLPALNVGIRHGIFCLGCCWALMLVMFGVGVTSLIWLMALTAVMVLEKATRWGRRLVPFVGIGLIGLAIVMLV
jgi:predicted metal-binding membrane protein